MSGTACDTQSNGASSLDFSERPVWLDLCAMMTPSVFSVKDTALALYTVAYLEKKSLSFHTFSLVLLSPKACTTSRLRPLFRVLRNDFRLSRERLRVLGLDALSEGFWVTDLTKRSMISSVGSSWELALSSLAADIWDGLTLPILLTARDLLSLLLPSQAVSKFFMFSWSSSAGSESVTVETGEGLSWDCCGTAPENFSVSVIIFPRVFVRSRWAARLRFWVRTLSRVVRYSKANSLMILQNWVTFVSLTE